jgi:perosamine synthetase
LKNGSVVAQFEREFASYVGAKYAIALCNGTATLHTALEALRAPGPRWPMKVAVPPLTMSATAIAVLHAGMEPVFVDVDPKTWLMDWRPALGYTAVPVSLYGLHYPTSLANVIDDAAQTLRPHNKAAAFTSYSFQASKILPLGEGGMLVTDDEGLAEHARSFSSLGYDMKANQPRIDPNILKSPDYARHIRMGWNYRMNDITAQVGLFMLEDADKLKVERQTCAAMYRDAIEGCDWLVPQHVPEGWTHDYWCYTVKIESPKWGAQKWGPLADLIEKHGGERPYAAWRLTYKEPGLKYLVGEYPCPVAEDLQPRLLQMQTNDIASAERNAHALRKAIQEIG